MRTSILFAALAATAIAAPAPAPQPQEIEFSSLDFSADGLSIGPDLGVTSESIPISSPSTDEVTANTKSNPASSRKSRRDITKRVHGDCAPQRPNSGPQFDLDPDAWLAAVAAAYPANNPDTIGPYTKVFDGLNGSVSQIGYRGVHTISSYDIETCMNYCDTKAQCLGFNFYVERDPSLDPGDGCPNPAPITNYKCTLWSFPFLAGAADNTGQTRDEFKVVIASSVGYVKPYVASNLANFTSAGQNLYGSINAPSFQGTSTFLGSKTYPSDDVTVDYFEPAICATACDAQTAYLGRHHNSTPCSYQACNFFDIYVVLQDGKAQGITCALYSVSWDDSYAVNGGQTRSGVVYKVASSYTYSNSRSPATRFIDVC
ncbi:hypothetical protein AA313_de0200199 [Arthrobotrys entomopaga]|nr:hypothetical protein AA313_de0200199 [Arthrobotrys entomopaga]